MLKWGGWFQTDYLDREKRYIHTCEIYKIYEMTNT
jgi:hypothetical protein